ncbi:Speckle-type POZ protein like [Argiope bruennichi]|uniref:Speckle-type POZ protein like n=1 Tax=Argiope bruennichi TaxID=94029 RepID=A0A8T0FMM8_ARGBR|nr:Speckle-type POZ protein like [Argiope bruennichi]
MGSECLKNKTGCTFQWKINNFSYCWQKTGEYLQSPEFSADMGKQTKWKLCLYPRGDESSNFICVCVYRVKDTNNEDNLEVCFQISALSADESIPRTVATFRSLIKEGQFAGHSDLLKRDDLFSMDAAVLLPDDTLTVQCDMWTIGGRDMKNVHYYARTFIKVEQITFIWSVTSFSSLKLNCKIPFAIRSVSNALLAGLHLFVERDCCCERIWLELKLSDENIKFFKMHSSIINETNEEIKSTRQEHEVFHEFSRSIKYSLPLTKGKLIDNNTLYLPKDILSLKFECAYTTGIGYEGIEHIDMRSTLLPGNPNKKKKLPETSYTLLHDIKTLYSIPFLCDVKLRTSTESFLAHKIILSSRSPVFTKMFANDASGKEVHITDVDSKTLSRLLLYIYTDTLEDLDVKAASLLYEAAAKYCILSLKEKCSTFLKNNLDPSNASDVLIIADMDDDKDFKLDVQDYILEHDCVFRSEKWKDLIHTKPELTAETMLRKFTKM